MKKVVLIDGMNCFVRSFAAISLTNDNGDHTGGLFGTLQSIISTIDKFRPDYVYFAWEGRHSSERRRKILKEYKEGRTFVGFNRLFDLKPEEERLAFKNQLEKLKIIIECLPIYQGSVDYLEADDLIAYLCQKTLRNYENYIVSSDRDYLQLINDSTFVYRPVKTKECKDGEIAKLTKENENYFISFYALNGKLRDNIPCHPTNYYLTKCIGEPTDNIEGIKGVGQKTFLKDFPFLVSLKESGHSYSMSDILEYAEKNINIPKYKKYLIPENKEILIRNEKLIQLLEPDISLKSLDTIENTLKSSIEFDRAKFRISLMKESISPVKINSWITSLNSLDKDKIEF